ncbi:hypothetical protein GQ457_15G017970 [Hibiscus cannabinus]
MQLRSQLQRIEARQIHFQEKMKVFNANLLKFLHFQFPAAARFFVQPSTTPSQPNVSAAAQPSATASAKAGAIEEVHFSSDDENDVFNWQSPRDHLQPLGPITTTPAPTVLFLSAALTPTTSIVAERPTPDSPARRKGKVTAGRTFGRDIQSSPEDEADQRPAKRRRKYHVITADSDEEDSSAEIPVSKPMHNSILGDRSCTEATLSTRTQNMSRQITSRESLPRVEERKIRKGLPHQKEGRYPCDNGYKEVTVLPSRDIVYDRVKQLIGLRHKPITQQDALPRSDSQPRFTAKVGPVVSVRDIPFVILLKQNIEAPP